MPINKLLRYKAWADEKLFEALGNAPDGVLESERKIVFGSIVRTVHHNFAMDEVWRANLLGVPHGYTTRNPATCPPLAELHPRQTEIDRWYVDYACGLTDEQLQLPVNFNFIGGGPGEMTRFEILMHVVIHATYHRGHVGAMLYDAGVVPPTTDLPVYLKADK